MTFTQHHMVSTCLRFSHGGGDWPSWNPPSSLVGGRFPHTGGNGPIRVLFNLSLGKSFPHAGGDWPHWRRQVYPAPVVFPTQAGIGRRYPNRRDGCDGFPHTGGDGPKSALCFADSRIVFPTQAGIDRTATDWRILIQSLPHKMGIIRQRFL